MPEAVFAGAWAVNDKQFQSHVQAALNRKALALRMVAGHIAMLPANAEQAAKNRRMMPDSILVWAICVIGSDSPGWKRSIAMLALDLVSLDWREVAGPEIMGANVTRDDPLARKWRRDVLARDGRACQDCGSSDNLDAHHIVRWADDPSQRLVLENGKTLCRPCHIEEHRKYG